MNKDRVRRDPNKFARVPLGAIELAASGDIKVAHLGVLAALASYADNDTGVCFPTQDELADRCGYRSVNSLAEPLRALEGAGALARRSRWKRPKDGADGPKSYEPTGEFTVPTSTEYTITGYPKGRQYLADSVGTYPTDSGGTDPNDSGGPYPHDSGAELDPPKLDPIELAVAGGHAEVDAILRKGVRITIADEHFLNAAGMVWNGRIDGWQRREPVTTATVPAWFTDFGLTEDDWSNAQAKNLTTTWLQRKLAEARSRASNPVAYVRAAIKGEEARDPIRSGGRLWQE